MGKIGIIIIISLLLLGCEVGPNYHPVPVVIPPRYKEGAIPPPGWKMATPQDELNRGPWWQVFHNQELDHLEDQLNICNQNIALAEAQYLQSMALVTQARSALFPVISSYASYTRQKPSSSTFNSNSGTGTGGQGITQNKSLPPFNTYILNFSASWQPDLWGGIRRSLESSIETEQASAAQIAAVQLSSQALLAEDYFQLRTLDKLQVLLNQIVVADQKLVNLTRAKMQAGTSSLADLALTLATLEAAQAAAIDNGINRAQFEHAIAVLIGVPPENFSLKPIQLALVPPKVPVQVPSQLLERRPDIAEAERKVAAANAEIGVQIATFFPTLPLTASTGWQTNKFSQWFSGPASYWIIGAELMDTLFQGGYRIGLVRAAKAVYLQNVASYRQTVLSAFQNVEDNLAAHVILRREEVVQHKAVAIAKLSLRLNYADYQAGTVDLTTILTAQTNTFNIEINEINVMGRQMVAAVGLITALGGGWDACLLNCAPP